MPRVPAEQRREQLIEAAVKVIAREGLSRATTRRIAEEAKAPLVTLHYNFDNKDDLFVAVLKHTQKLALENFRNRVEPGAGVERAAQALIEMHLEMTVDDPDFMIVQYELLFWAVRTASARRYAPMTYRGYFDVVDEIFAEASTEGETPEEIKRLSRYTLAILDGMILQKIALGRRGPGKSDVPRYTEGAVAAAKGLAAIGAKAKSNGAKKARRRTPR